jgi:uncharacterized protein
MRLNLFLTCLLIVGSISPRLALASDQRDFPIPTGLVTDFTGALSATQVESIEGEVKRANDANGLDGRVVIVPTTKEWYLNEYAKDYGDFLQAQGTIAQSGWIIYLSTDDRKFALVVQSGATSAFPPIRRREIELILDQGLESGDTTGAILKAVQAVADLPRTHQAAPKKGFSPNNLIFLGLAIILFTLVVRSRRQIKRKE